MRAKTLLKVHINTCWKVTLNRHTKKVLFLSGVAFVLRNLLTLILHFPGRKILFYSENYVQYIKSWRYFRIMGIPECRLFFYLGSFRWSFLVCHLYLGIFLHWCFFIIFACLLRYIVTLLLVFSRLCSICFRDRFAKLLKYIVTLLLVFIDTLCSWNIVHFCYDMVWHFCSGSFLHFFPICVRDSFASLFR